MTSAISARVATMRTSRLAEPGCPGGSRLTWGSMGMMSPLGRNFLARAAVGPNDRKNQAKAADQRPGEADHREPGEAEDLEGRRYLHEMGRSDDQRGKNQADRNPVGDFLKIFQKMRFRHDVDADAQLSVQERVQK